MTSFTKHASMEETLRHLRTRCIRALNKIVMKMRSCVPWKSIEVSIAYILLWAKCLVRYWLKLEYWLQVSPTILRTPYPERHHASFSYSSVIVISSGLSSFSFRLYILHEFCVRSSVGVCDVHTTPSSFRSETYTKQTGTTELISQPARSGHNFNSRL